jgi:hypothetical protein
MSLAAGPYHWSPFVKFSVYNKIKVKLMRSSNHTEHKKNCIISRSQNTTALQPSVFATGMHPVTDHKKMAARDPRYFEILRSQKW